MHAQFELDIGKGDISDEGQPRLCEYTCAQRPFYCTALCSSPEAATCRGQGSWLPLLSAIKSCMSSWQTKVNAVGRFNLETGDTTVRQVADTICDFPRVPLNLVGTRLSPLISLVQGHALGADEFADCRECTAAT